MDGLMERKDSALDGFQVTERLDAVDGAGAGSKGE